VRILRPVLRFPLYCALSFAVFGPGWRWCCRDWCYQSHFQVSRWFVWAEKLILVMSCDDRCSQVLHRPRGVHLGPAPARVTQAARDVYLRARPAIRQRGRRHAYLLILAMVTHDSWPPFYCSYYHAFQTPLPKRTPKANPTRGTVTVWFECMVDPVASSSSDSKQQR